PARGVPTFPRPTFRDVMLCTHTPTSDRTPARGVPTFPRPAFPCIQPPGDHEGRPDIFSPNVPTYPAAGRPRGSPRYFLAPRSYISRRRATTRVAPTFPHPTFLHVM